LSNRAANSGVTIPAKFSNAMKWPIFLPNSFSLPRTLKFSSKKACPVQLQKLRYNAAKNAAITNPTNDGNNAIVNAETKLQTTEITNDFFLPMVSANTEVGNSNIRITIVDIFDINTMCARDSHTCWYKSVTTGTKNTNPAMKLIRV
jgi:hypothetical protein